MLQLCLPVINKVQTMFSPLIITDENANELRMNANQMSKNCTFLRAVYVPTKKSVEKWEKTIHHEPVCVGPMGRNLTRDSAIFIPDKHSDPSSDMSLSYMDTHDGLLYSYRAMIYPFMKIL